MNEQELRLMDLVAKSAESNVKLLAILRDQTAGAYEMSKDPDMLPKVNKHLQQVDKHMNQMLERLIEHYEAILKVQQAGKLARFADDPAAFEEFVKGLDE